MVELRLPKNSRISPNGKVWDHKKSSAKKLTKLKYIDIIQMKKVILE